MSARRTILGGVLVLIVLSGAISYLGWRQARIPAPAPAPVPIPQPTPEPSSEPAGAGAQTARPANRLIREKSPYLLQHADSPVDWYPWGEEAFAKATAEEKPVMLSIGFSSCYWCHVMDQESFDHPDVARLINESVVPIKVDREERPDIDAIYMQAVLAISGGGGWPMTVFLTPNGQPFWGGTYFPPEDRAGRPGLPTILRSITDAWRTRRPELVGSSHALTQVIKTGIQAGEKTELTEGTLTKARTDLAAEYDHTSGGFGGAPKFPRSHTLSFLLQTKSRGEPGQALNMVRGTLDGMARGGMHDQLGGGFHRFSSDGKWLVPHFEKMLSDQAMLARTYLQAYQATGVQEYADLARDILDYVIRELRDPVGAFHAAEDAGEVGQEGEYYVWTHAELQELLEPEEAELLSAFYGVTPEGNFERGTNVLHVPLPEPEFAAQRGLSAGQMRERLAGARAKLLAARIQRPRPRRDDKILTDWNGLMIGALAYGARALTEPAYATAASEAATFLLGRLQRDGQLLHRYRDGSAEIPAFLDDYAFLAWGLADLYETTFDPRWLRESKRLTSEMIRLFWDEAEGGFWLTGPHHEPLIAKTKVLYDGSLPSGNSVAALNLLRLGWLTMDTDFQERARRLLETFSGQLTEAPAAFPQALMALDWWLGPSQEIVIAGDPSDPETRRMVRAVHERYLPRAVVALHPSGEAGQEIESLVPFIKDQQPLNGRATVYICENYVCKLPTSDLAKATSLLDAL